MPFTIWMWLGLIFCTDGPSVTAKNSGWICPKVPEVCQCYQPRSLKCQGHAEQLDGILDSLIGLDDGSVVFLELSLWNLTVIESNSFKVGLTLPNLFISSDGKLETIEDGAFVGIRDVLKALGLFENSLYAIPGEVFQLKKLERLDLSKNHITGFGRDAITYMRSATSSSLTYLDLSFNHLSEIEDVSLPSSLVTLKAEGNQLTSNDLPKIGINEALKVLVLSRNNLDGTLLQTHFHFQDASSGLETLDLSFNGIEGLGFDAFRSMENLKTLKLSSNAIELLDEMTFKSVGKLTLLDLSHNRILELTGGVFAPLQQLTHLDLSHNHLQVVDTGMTYGLVSLAYLDLEANDIIKVEEQSLQSCHALTTVLLTGNPLDCSCHLSDFQRWLQENVRLDGYSRQQARCATPPGMANGVLSELPKLSCDVQKDRDHTSHETVGEDFDFDYSYWDTMQKLGLTLVNESVDDENDVLTMSWSTSADLPSYKCHDVQVICDTNKVTGNGIFENEVYSAPLNCGSVTNDTLITVTIDTSKIPSCSDAGRPSYHLVCISIENATQPDEVGSGQVEDEDVQLIPGCSQVQLNKRREPVQSLTAALQENGSLLVNYLNTENASLQKCIAHLEIRDVDVVDLGDGESIVNIAKIPCWQQHYQFATSRSYNANSHLKVCMFQELGYDEALDTRTDRTCSQVQVSVDDSSALSRKKKPFATEKSILPLVLTLVVLCLGIFALVVCYLVVKGCLSDRRQYYLSQFYPANNNLGEESLSASRNSDRSRLTWIIRLISPLRIPAVKGDRRRHPLGDELYLDDDDNGTEMSLVT